MSTERILVHQSIATEFGAALSRVTQQRYGTGSPPYILINSAAVAKNKRLVNEAVGKGAKVLHDAGASENQPTKMRAVIVSGVSKDMEIYHTESFGPTVSLLTFQAEEEAVALANDNDYGLSGRFFRDLDAALRVARGYETRGSHQLDDGARRTLAHARRCQEERLRKVQRGPRA